MKKISSDIILFITRYLNASEKRHLKLTSKYFNETIFIMGWVEDEDSEINSSKIIFTQSWYYQYYTMKKKGRICWTCGLICSSRNKLFLHLYIDNHYSNRRYILCDIYQLYYRIRSLQDYECIVDNCTCTSKLLTNQDLLEASSMIIYTRYGKITLNYIYCKGYISGLFLCDTQRYHYPCIYINYLNIYTIRNHYWISYYYSYDDRLPYQSLMIPIQRIVIS